MTGEASVRAVSPHYLWHLQLRSLNHRFIEVRLHLPVVLRPYELEIRRRLEETLHRGQVTLYVSAECKDPVVLDIPFDYARVTFVVQLLKKVAETLKVPLPDPLAIVMRMPDVFIPEKVELPPEDLRVFREALEQAIEKLNQYRIEEGKHHATALQRIIDEIEKHTQQIASLERQRLETLKSLLTQQIKQLHSPRTIPPESTARLEEEMIYWAQKMDIHEELVRLSAHIDHFRQTLATATPLKGRRVDFLAQEILREANTIAAKAQHARIQHLAVELKERVEQIRQLAANIL